jgi:thiamine kinase-like enzyme
MKSYCVVFFCLFGQLYTMEQLDHEALVHKGFEQFVGTIWHYKPEQNLSGGLLSIPPYVCEVNDKQYVVRLFKKSLPERHVGVLTHIFVGNKNLAPMVHYSHHGDEFSFIIMDFINTPTLSLQQARNPEVIRCVAQQLKKIGQFNPDMTTNYKENVFDEIMRIHNAIESKKVAEHYFMRKILKEMKYTAETINQKIKDDNRPLVINHNDFHPRNIFFTNNDIKIVDWDTLALNYQFYDLVGYSLFSCLNEEQESDLLTEYLERTPTLLDTDYFEKVKLMGRVCLVLSGFQFVENLPKNMTMYEIKDFEHYATAFAQDSSSDSPDFFYAFGMSQLRELRKECKKFLK